MNKRELLRQIYFERITDVAELPERERAMVAGDDELAAAIARNRGFAPLAHTTPPDRDGVLAESYRRTQQLPRTGWHARNGWVLRFALVLAAVVVVGAAVLLANNRHGTDDNAPVWQAGTTAWAATSGYIIEYELNPSGLDVWQKPEFPIDRFDEVVKLWLSDKGLSAAGPGGRPLVLVNADNRHFDNPSDTLNLRVDFVQLDEGLRDNLVEYIEAETGYVPFQITEREFYYNEKYPDFCTPQRTITIDGQDYLFPYDFTDDEIEQLVNRFFRGPHIRYSGHAGFGVDKRFGDCDVFRFERLSDGNLVFSVAADHLDIEENVRQLIRTSSLEYEPTHDDLYYPWRDPVLELVREAQNLAYLMDAGSIEMRRYHITWTLVPDELWAPVEARRRKMKLDLFNSLRTHSEEEESFIQEWAEMLQVRMGSELAGSEFDEVALSEISALGRFFPMDEYKLRISDEYKAVDEIPEEDRLRALDLSDKLTELTAEWYHDNAREFYTGHPYYAISRSEHWGMFPRDFVVSLTTDDMAYVNDLVDFLVAGSDSRNYEITESGMWSRIGSQESPLS